VQYGPGLKPSSNCWLHPGVETPGSLRAKPGFFFATPALSASGFLQAARKQRPVALAA